jgi:tetratricopeptide (TPR) repeat protein
MRLFPALRLVAVFWIFAISGIARPALAQGATSPAQNGQAADSYEKEPYLFDFIEKKIRFEANGTGQRETAFRVRIQSESAVRELWPVVYPFASGFESLEVDYVRVRKPDGTVVETPPADVQAIDTAVSRIAPMYSDEREKHIAVKSLAVGDVLEARLRWTIHDAMAPGYFWYDQNFFKDGICLRERLTIDVPAKVDVRLRSPWLQPDVRVEGARRVYTFERAILKRPPESKIPDWERDARGAAPPDVQMTSFSSWAEVGKWFTGLEQSKIAVTPEIQAKADELTKGKASQQEKIKALYDFVSTRFRYIGVELGQSRFTPHSAVEVMQNRYGDCKDKQVLLTALLGAVGVGSYPALVSSKFRVDPSFPTVSLFDHVITAIPRDGSVQFVDATPEVAAFGFLAFPIRDRKALLIPANAAASLVDTPADPPVPSYELFHMESTISADGTLDGRIRMEDRGDPEVMFRAAYHSTPQNQWEKLTQRVFAALGFGGNVCDVDVNQPENAEQPFTVKLAYRRTEYPYWKEKRITFPVPPFFLRTLTEEQKQADTPLPLGPLQDLSYETTVKFPEGYAPVFPGKPTERKTDFAEFLATYEIQKGVLTAKFHLKTLLREIPAAERSSYSAFADAVRQEMSRYILISTSTPDTPSSNSTPSTPNPPQKEVKILRSTDDNVPAGAAAPAEPIKEHLGQVLFDAAVRADRKGDHAAAAQIFEQVVAKDPKNALAWSSLGFNYNFLQQYAKAETALRKAIELNPKDRFAYSNLGNACLGQKKYEEAIPFFLKQIEIVPDDKWAHANLGRSYLLTKRFDKAVETLERAARLAPDDTAVHFNLARAYASTGKSNRALEEFQKSAALEPIPSRWNAVAYQMAVEKIALDQAEHYAELAIELTDSRLREISLDALSNEDARLPAALGAYWDTLGWVKFQQGDVAAAERYIRSAWQLRSIAEIGDHLGQVYEKLGRKQDAATMYALSIATGSPMPETEARLTALVGKNTDIKQLAQDARNKSVAVKNERDLDGEAEFWLLLERGPKVSASKFIGGEGSLRGLADGLKSLAIEFSFPDTEEIKLPRRARVNCSRVSGTCGVTLASSETVRSAN